MKRTVAALLLLVAACASDGRTLRAPQSGASAPPLASTTAPAQGGTLGSALALSSIAFLNGGAIPVQYTCDGGGASPPLAWGAVPEGTIELVVTVIDPDARGFVHWVLAGLDSHVQAIGEGAVPEGAVQAQNGAGSIGWTGPCPPRGAPHHYVFTLYALSTPSGITTGEPGADALAKLAKLQAKTAALTGTYQRAG